MSTTTTALPTYLLLALRGLEFLAEREIHAKLKVNALRIYRTGSCNV